jgi:hypothetical protein
MPDKPEALIEINDQLLGIWFMPLSATSNWMAGMSRTDDGHIKLAWRMRYYNPESVDPHDGKDRRSRYTSITNDPEDVAIEKLRTIARVLTEHAKGPLYEILRGNRTTQEMFAELQRQPWAHAKVERVERVESSR